MPTVVLTPNQDPIPMTGVSVTGASLNAAWSDGSDATYATWTAPYGQATAGFTTVSLPAGAVTSTIRLTLRLSGAALVSSGVQAVVLATIAGTQVPVATVGGQWLYSTGDIAYPAQSVFLTQAELDSVVLQVTAVYDPAASPTFRVYQASLTLVYVTAPTVAVSAPTGAQATSMPTAVWSHTPGSDGGPQTHYVVVVCSAAEYGIGGFDPWYSPATYSSGIVASSATSLVVGNLVNGTTYRAYVATAQTINGVRQWSVPIGSGTIWAFSSFTTSFVTAIISTTVATTSNAGGYNTVTVTRQSTAPNTAWEFVTVERSTDGGVTYKPLRGGNVVAQVNNFLTVWGASSMTIRDYDAGNGQSVIYRARAYTAASGSGVWGAWVSSSAVAWTSTDTWIKDPLVPSRSTSVLRTVSLSGLSRNRTQGVFTVVGRADPIVISDVLSTRSGTAVVRTTSDADAVLLQALLDNAPIWLLQQPASDQWGSKYVAVSSVTEVRLNEQKMSDPWRFWQVQYSEVSSPVDQT